MNIKQTVLDLAPKKKNLVLNTQGQVLDFFTIARCPSKEEYLKVREAIGTGECRLVDPAHLYQKSAILNVGVNSEVIEITDELNQAAIQAGLEIIDKLYENRQRIRRRNTIWAVCGAFVVFCIGYRIGEKAGLVKSLFDVEEDDNVDIIEDERTRIIVVSKE